MIELVSKSIAMGLLASDGATDVTRATLENLLEALRAHRMGEDAQIHLAPLLHEDVEELDSALAADMTKKVHA